jgi:hypothetical protein
MKIQFSQEVWDYISPHQKDLIISGNYLLDYFTSNSLNILDFSFIIFPFAKAYEGYLKQLFLDVNFITEEEYESDYLRLGKLLSPNNSNAQFDTTSVYNKIRDTVHVTLAKKVWITWKKARNEVFHYFPHNYKQVGYGEALQHIHEIKQIIEESYALLFSLCKECKSNKYNVGPQGFEP